MKPHYSRMWILVSVVGAMPGCIAPLMHRNPERTRSDPPQPPPPKAVAQATTSQQKVLDAVEAFLERTSDYQSPDVNLSTPKEPLPHVVTASGIPTDRSAHMGLTKPQPIPLQPPTITRYTTASPMTLSSPTASRGLAANGQAGRPTPIETGVNAQGSISFDQRAQALPVVQSITIRPRSASAAVNSRPSSIVVTNQPPPEDSSPLAGEALIDRFLSYLQSVAKTKLNFDNEWRLRMANLALNRDSQAVAVSTALPEDTRTLLSHLIRAAQGVRRVARNPDNVDPDVVTRVDELRSALANRADPIIRTIVLCKKVVTFGVYEELDPSVLVAGAPIPVIVYSEIDHFRSDRTPEGHYRTKLGTRLEILTPTGESLWQHEEPEIVDDCRRRRSDFFIAQRVTVPGTLPAGDYVLKVRVEDKLSGRLTEGSATFAMKSATPAVGLP